MHVSSNYSQNQTYFCKEEESIYFLYVSSCLNFDFFNLLEEYTYFSSLLSTRPVLIEILCLECEKKLRSMIFLVFGLHFFIDQFASQIKLNSQTYNKSKTFILTMQSQKQELTSNNQQEANLASSTTKKTTRGRFKRKKYTRGKFKRKKYKGRRHSPNDQTQKHQFNSSLWSLTENVSYMNFLVLNIELFSMTKVQRRDSKINVLMSQAIGTRSPHQCRSHHQKMIKYHVEIQRIIDHVCLLRQIKEDKQWELINSIQQKFNEPVLLDFLQEENIYDSLSFCDRLMIDQ